jgi:hypothetical protein
MKDRWSDEVYGRFDYRNPKTHEPQHREKLACGCIVGWDGSAKPVPKCPLHKNGIEETEDSQLTLPKT